jgi:hypothetical protein
MGSWLPACTRLRSAALCACGRRVATEKSLPSAPSVPAQRQPRIDSTLPLLGVSEPLQSVGCLSFMPKRMRTAAVGSPA